MIHRLTTNFYGEERENAKEALKQKKDKLGGGGQK